MKTLKLISLLLFILSIQYSCTCNCDDHPQINQDIKYPDLISPIYYIDTFRIVDPRIAIIDSVPYIFSFNDVETFSTKDDFLNQKGLIPFLTPHLHFYRTIDYLEIYGYDERKKTFQDMVTQSEFYFDKLFLKDDSLFSIPINRFAFVPEMFLLTLIAPIDSVKTAIGHEDSILEIYFSKDYGLALAPIYTKKDLKKINKLWISKLQD